MPAAIDTQVKKQVINQWLSGDSRDRIAADNGIGTGTVTNIINEWKKGVEDSDYESVRELAVSIKKQGIDMSTLACSVRLNNYIKNIGTNEDKIESFIVDLANSSEPEKLIDALIKSCIYHDLNRYHLETFSCSGKSSYCLPAVVFVQILAWIVGRAHHA